jgi:hypothetical protein
VRCTFFLCKTSTYAAVQQFIIPAKAGILNDLQDPRFRGDDKQPE